MLASHSSETLLIDRARTHDERFGPAKSPLFMYLATTYTPVRNRMLSASKLFTVTIAASGKDGSPVWPVFVDFRFGP